MRARSIPGLLLLAGVLVALPVGAVAQEEQTVTLTLPSGDPEAGRATFLAMSCTSCHRVEGETKFPNPVSANPGPTLGAYQAHQDPARLGMSIYSPTHELSGTVRHPDADGLSPMPDFTEIITVRQFLDLIAYIRSLPKTGG